MVKRSGSDVLFSRILTGSEPYWGKIAEKKLWLLCGFTMFALKTFSPPQRLQWVNYLRGYYLFREVLIFSCCGFSFFCFFCSWFMFAFRFSLQFFCFYSISFYVNQRRFSHKRSRGAVNLEKLRIFEDRG